MPDACFTYGSLMHADIMTRVCGHPVVGMPAKVADYRRAPVRGEDYPGMVGHPGGSVEGVLYTGLGSASWARLDAFEGEIYRRAPLRAVLAGGVSVEAWAYLFKPEFVYLLQPGDWDPAEFLARGKARFEARYLGFAAIDPMRSDQEPK